MDKYIVTTEDYIDSETGKRVYRKKEKVKVKPEAFLYLYTNRLADILRLSNTEKNVIISLIALHSGSVKKYIQVIGSVKSEISNHCDISINTVDKTLKKLVDKKLLMRPFRGEYLLNPTYFFKGSTVDRDAVFEMVIEYLISEEETAKTIADIIPEIPLQKYVTKLSKENSDV